MNTNSYPQYVRSIYSQNRVSFNVYTHPGKMPDKALTGQLNPSGLIMHKHPTKENRYTFKVAGSSGTNDMGAAYLMPNATNFIYAPFYNTTIIYNSKTINHVYEGKYKK